MRPSAVDDAREDHRAAIVVVVVVVDIDGDGDVEVDGAIEFLALVYDIVGAPSCWKASSQCSAR